MPLILIFLVVGVFRNNSSYYDTSRNLLVYTVQDFGQGIITNVYILLASQADQRGCKFLLNKVIDIRQVSSHGSFIFNDFNSIEVQGHFFRLSISDTQTQTYFFQQRLLKQCIEQSDIAKLTQPMVCTINLQIILEMERHQTQLLKIYSDANSLVHYKRKLLKSMGMVELPTSPLQEEMRMSSTKMYIWICKFMTEFKKDLDEFGSSDNGSQCLVHLTKITQDLKNDSELFTQQEAIIADLKRIKQAWNEEKDPLIYYEQGERLEMKRKLTEKLQQLLKWEEMSRSTKKPLYIRKLERELRDNLQKIGQEQRRFNHRQLSLYMNTKWKLTKLVSKLLDAVERMNRESLVTDQKNQFLRKYIDVFNDSQRIAEKDMDSYRKDFRKTIQNMLQIFKQEQYCFSLLMQYINNLESLSANSYKKIIRTQDEFSAEMNHISQEIYCIVDFHEIIQVVYYSKHFLAITREWGLMKLKMNNVKSFIQEVILMLKDFNAKSSWESGRKNKPIQEFIQDKRIMENLVKKESQIQEDLFESWKHFLLKYLKILKETPRLEQKSHLRASKTRLDSAFDRLFISYLQQTEAYEKRDSIGLSLRHNNKSFISEIEHFIKQTAVFSGDIDWNGSYQCSLGPRLLIHGRLQVLPSGIYYQSSFNQKNYFFGRTKIFLPKEQIFEVNKQTVLLLFPDVLEVITKFGGVYFHALGKRQAMYQHFISTYLPQINKINDNQEQLIFNEFKGEQKVIQQRIQPFFSNLQNQFISGVVQNQNLRSFFYKYYSNTQFFYQGRTYKDFKNYLCILAEGKNIKCSDFTPGVPYYLQLATDKTKQMKDFEESERLFTYGKQIPTIPFVSKGGDGVCQEKNVYRWGGLNYLVIDIFTTVSGFSLTQGMTVKSRQVFREVNNSVHFSVSGEVTFTTSSAINGMIRAPAISSLKDFLTLTMEKIVKLQKNRAQSSGTSSKRINFKDQCERQSQKIEQLQLQIISLKNKMRLMSILFAIVYFLTIIFIHFGL